MGEDLWERKRRAIIKVILNRLALFSFFLFLLLGFGTLLGRCAYLFFYLGVLRLMNMGPFFCLGFWIVFT